MYQVIRGMMTELKGGLNSPLSVDLRIPKEPPAFWGKWSPKGCLADDSQTRTGPMINPCINICEEGKEKEKDKEKEKGNEKGKGKEKGKGGFKLSNWLKSPPMKTKSKAVPKPKWQPKKTSAPSSKNLGHYNAQGVWTSRPRGRQRRLWTSKQQAIRIKKIKNNKSKQKANNETINIYIYVLL